MILASAQGPADYSIARLLFQEYSDSRPNTMCFPGFQNELQSLDTIYGPPTGDLLLLMDENENPAGCVAVRRIDESTCELKRMYVRPAARNQGAGRMLLEAAMESARQLGYVTMRLDTLDFMERAIRLYEASGFLRVDSFNGNPKAGVVYMSRGL